MISYNISRMIIYYIVQINISNLYLTIWYYKNAIKLYMYQYQDFFQANKSQSVEFFFTRDFSTQLRIFLTSPTARLKIFKPGSQSLS